MSTKFKYILSTGSISLLHVTGMALAPVFMVFINKWNHGINALFFGVIMLTTMTVCALLSSNVVIWDRIVYRALFVFMFICVYTILKDGTIKVESIIQLIKWLLIAHCVVILLQICLYLIGITKMPLLNYQLSLTMDGVAKPNGLTDEASHSARILTILYWGYLALNEVKNGIPVSVKDAFTKHRELTILFLLSMITMGSATAIIGILIVCMYFLGKNIVLIVSMAAMFIILMNVETDNSQLKRVQTVYNSMYAEDTRTTLMKSEGSGAVRILPILNTFSIDLFDSQSWIGQGNDQETNAQNYIKRMFSETRYIGDVESYGLLTYIATLLFVYGCCIKKFFSMESLIFLGLATFSVGSVYYTWLMLMIFSIVKYYTETYTPQLE